MFNKAKCPGSGLARFAAAMRDIVIDIGDNWKIIGYINFTLTDHTEGAPNSKSDKLGKIVWYMLGKNRFEHYNINAVFASRIYDF